MTMLTVVQPVGRRAFHYPTISVPFKLVIYHVKLNDSHPRLPDGMYLCACNLRGRTSLCTTDLLPNKCTDELTLNRK